MKTLRRYAGIYLALWKNSVAREMSFKSNFLLWIIVELLWFGLQLCFIGVLYLHTDHIGTWTKWEVVMLIGASHFIQQIFSRLDQCGFKRDPWRDDADDQRRLAR